jgi:hypothetical protein
VFKKILRRSIIVFMVVGIIVSLISFSDYLFAYRDEHDPGGGGGGTAWDRWEEQCPANADREWAVHCSSGGDEQCTATYCYD